MILDESIVKAKADPKATSKEKDDVLDSSAEDSIDRLRRLQRIHPTERHKHLTTKV